MATENQKATNLGAVRLLTQAAPTGTAVQLDPDDIEQIAHRVAELIDKREASPAVQRFVDPCEGVQ